MVAQSTLIVGSVVAVAIVGATLYGRKASRRSLPSLKSLAQSPLRKKATGMYFKCLTEKAMSNCPKGAKTTWYLGFPKLYFNAIHKLNILVLKVKSIAGH